MTAFPLYSPISSNTPKGNRAISTTKTKPNRCTHRYTHYHSSVSIAVEQALDQLVHQHQPGTNEHKCLSALEKPTSCGGTGRRAAPRPTPIPNPRYRVGSMPQPFRYRGMAVPIPGARHSGSTIADLRDWSRALDLFATLAAPIGLPPWTNRPRRPVPPQNHNKHIPAVEFQRL